MKVSVHRLLVCLFWVMPFALRGQYPPDDSLQRYLTQATTDEQRCTIYLQMGSKWMQTNPVASLEAARKAEEIAGRLRSPALRAGAEVVLSKALLASGDMIGSLDHALNGMQLARQYHLRKEEADATAMLGAAYLYLREPDTCIYYFRKSIALSAELKDSMALAKAFNNVGAGFSYLKKQDSALRYYRLSHDIAFKVTGKEQPILQNNIGEILYLQGRITEALPYFRASLAGKKAVNNRMMQGKTYRHLAECFLGLGQKDSVLYPAEQALALSREFNHVSEQILALQVLGRVYAALGDLSKAYESSARSTSLMDSFEISKSQEAVARAEVKQHLAFKERTNHLLREELIVEKERQKLHYTLLLAATVIVLSLLALLLVLWRLNQDRKTNMTRVAELNATLEQRVQERTQALEMRNQQLLDYADLNSHALRSRVATLSGLLSLLDRATFSLENQRYMQLVDVAAEELDQVVHEINDAVKAQTGEEGYRASS